jgi:hypothetical protein
MPDSASDDEDHPIRINKNKKRRKLINQYALLSDNDDDDEDDANTTPPPTTDIATPKPNNPRPKQGILHIASSKGTEKCSITFSPTCNEEKSEWRILKQTSPPPKPSHTPPEKIPTQNGTRTRLTQTSTENASYTWAKAEAPGLNNYLSQMIPTKSPQMTQPNGHMKATATMSQTP